MNPPNPFELTDPDIVVISGQHVGWTWVAISKELDPSKFGVWAKDNIVGEYEIVPNKTQVFLYFHDDVAAESLRIKRSLL